MSKSKWWKNKETGEVVLQTGSNRQNMGTVFYRVRSGETFSEAKSKFFSSHIQIEASGFPAEKPKEFKPRYAIHDWPEGEAYVEEFEPDKFKIVDKDGTVTLRPGAWKFFKKFFEDGTWQVVSEAEAKARLDKPKAPVPASEQFDFRATYYGLGVEYHPTWGGELFRITKPGGFVYRSEDTVCATVVRNLWDLGMVVTTKPEPEKPPFDITKTYESVHGGYYLVPNPYGDAFYSYRSKDNARIGTWTIDIVKDEYRLGRLRVRTKPEPEKPKKKKVLVEWAIVIHSGGACRTELWPESQQAPPHGLKCFKTGRTVEVPE